MAEPYDRYYFIGARVTGANRYWSAFLVASNLVLIAVFRTPPAFAMFGIFALGGVYGLLRPAQAGLFVELRDEELIVNVLTRRVVRYEELDSAHFLRYKERDFFQGILGAANMLGRFFGGSAPKMKPGEVDENIVLVDYKRPRWVYFPLPPFIWYHKSLYLRVERAKSLMAAINVHIAKSQ